MHADGVPNVDRRSGFWNGTSRYGVVHHLSPQSERDALTTLLVFVHGLFGDCRRTWGEMPRWVLDNAGVDLNVIPFDYPALNGFALVEDAETCTALLQRTLFLPTGPETYRFAHRIWQEFLLAQYFALCLERACFEDLGRAKFYSGVYRMAGELLPHTIIDQTMIEHVLATWSKESQRSYLMSNIIGFLKVIEFRAIRPELIT